MSDMIVEPNEVTTLVEYGPFEPKITALAEELKGKVYDLESGKGLAEAKADKTRWVRIRTSLENIRIVGKRQLLAQGKLIDGEAKRLTAIAAPHEEALAEKIKAREDEKAAAKAKRERIERERVEKISSEIDDFRFLLSEHHPSSDIANRLGQLAAIVIDSRFGEFQEMAKVKLDEQRGRCRTALRAAMDRESAEAERKAEEKRVAKEKADRDAEIQAAQGAEDKRLEYERKELEEKQAADREAQVKEDTRLAAEQKRIDDEREALAREKAEAEEKRLAGEMVEKRAAEEARQLEADKEAWDKLVEESVCAGPTEAFGEIYLLAAGESELCQSGAMRKIAAICVANNTEVG